MSMDSRYSGNFRPGCCGKSELTIIRRRIALIPIIKCPNYGVISIGSSPVGWVEIVMVLVFFDDGCWWIWFDIALRFSGPGQVIHQIPTNDERP